MSRTIVLLAQYVAAFVVGFAIAAALYAVVVEINLRMLGGQPQLGPGHRRALDGGPA